MLGRFGRDAGSLLGVEIASDSVRILQLRRRRGCHAISAWAVEPFKAPLGSWVAQPDVVADALRRGCHRSGTRQRLAAVALPGSDVICKICRLPARLSDNEMEARLLADAERLFPYPLQDLALDFQRLGPTPGQADEVNVLVGACRQRLLEPLAHVFDSAGLQVAAVEVDSLALFRALGSVCRVAGAVLRIEAHGATLHAWPEPSVPQRLELKFVADQGPAQRLECLGHWLRSALATTPLECLRVAVCCAMGDGWVQALAQQLPVPCKPFWPAAGEGAGPADPAMALAYGLALGGAR